MARAKISCLTLTNWAFGSLKSDINTFSNKYWTHRLINIKYCASSTENLAPFVAFFKNVTLDK
jgi:hypothetical protein